MAHHPTTEPQIEACPPLSRDQQGGLGRQACPVHGENWLLQGTQEDPGADLFPRDKLEALHPGPSLEMLA